MPAHCVYIFTWTQRLASAFFVWEIVFRDYKQALEMITAKWVFYYYL